MEKDVAKLIINKILLLGNNLNDLAELSQRIQDNEEKTEFRKELGLVMGKINGNLLMPIIAQHPDLDPDK